MNGYHFRNWARTFECHPEKFFEPVDLEELRSIFKAAKEDGKKIRVIGCGHSPSDLCCTDDFMVSMMKFNKIVNLDEKKKVVTVQSGVKLVDLVTFLKEHNLALNVLPSIGDHSLGGVVSVSTHGSGAQYPIMADSVTRLTLLTADGNLLQCSRDENSEIFHSACTGLGMLGIILEMDIQCEDYYHLKHLRYPMLFDDFVDSVDELCQESDHFQSSYFPFTDHVVVSEINRVKPKVIRRFHNQSFLERCMNWFSMFILVYVMEFFYFLALYVPFMVRYVNQVIFWLLFSNCAYTVDGYERIAFFNGPFHSLSYVSEWMVERRLCGEALRRLRSLIQSTNFPAHLPIEIRFIRADSFWLSPAYQRDVCSINIMACCPYGRKPGHENYFRAFQEIMLSLGGRPHLAKDHRMNPTEMRKAFPKFEDFLRLRQTLDKHKIFTNEFIERVFEREALSEEGHIDFIRSFSEPPKSM